MKAALEFAANRPTGEDDSYQVLGMFSGGGIACKSEDGAELNPSQRLHLLTSAQYAGPRRGTDACL
jgi:hypothetical protein